MLTDHAAATSHFTETVANTGITVVLDSSHRTISSGICKQAVLDDFIQFMRGYSQM
jgi:hypothetical protein